MIELPDDELDKLFRKSSEELDPTFDPNDWGELKKRLDVEDGIRPGGWWRRLWPVGLVLLFLAGGIGSYFRMNNPETGEAKATPDLSGITDEAKVKRTDVMPAPETSAVGKDTLRDDAAKTASTVSEEKEELTKSKTEKILPRSRSKAGGVYLEPNRSDGKGGEGAFSSNIKKEGLANKKARTIKQPSNDEAILEKSVHSASATNTSENSVTGEGAIIDKKIKGADLASANIKGRRAKSDKTEIAKPENQKDENQKKVTQSVKAGNSKNSNPDYAGQTDVLNATPQAISVEKTGKAIMDVDVLMPHSIAMKKLLALPGIEPVAAMQETKAEPVVAQEPTPKFAVRMGYSPDLSTVGLKNFSKPGAAFALMVEYSIVRRLYAQTGIVSSKKIYRAKEGQYEWPADWATGPRPSSTDATCKVLEIPLNLRYDLIDNRRFRWFAGAGVSSYYMQNEKYVYNYPPHTYGIKWKEYEDKTGWYLLSHINASAGYEHRLSEKLSLLAEPYVRIPVRHVGFGKVNLVTTGIWISLRYTPVFK